jgi:hypothetical protein
MRIPYDQLPLCRFCKERGYEKWCAMIPRGPFPALHWCEHCFANSYTAVANDNLIASSSSRVSA